MKNSKNRKKVKKAVCYPESFEQFWTTYPRRESKGQALKAWPAAIEATAQSKLIDSDESPETFLARRASDYAATVASTEKKFIRLPSTWLNAHGWEDETKARVPTDSDLATWSASG